MRAVSLPGNSKKEVLGVGELYHAPDLESIPVLRKADGYPPTACTGPAHRKLRSCPLWAWCHLEREIGEPIGCEEIPEDEDWGQDGDDEIPLREIVILNCSCGRPVSYEGMCRQCYLRYSRRRKYEQQTNGNS